MAVCTETKYLSICVEFRSSHACCRGSNGSLGSLSITRVHANNRL
jgi:hypothetical protein